MNTPVNPPDTTSEQDRDFSIIVNARERTVAQKDLTFDEVVVLAFGPPNYDTSAYTITYRKGPEKNEKGSLLPGESVKLKSGMIFNVVRTDKS
jgi:Multiubiquitin